MPPKKRPAATASDYDSDNGFVEDAAPKSKRSKVSVSKDRGGGGGGTKGNEKDKRIDKHVDKDGEEFWEVCCLS